MYCTLVEPSRAQLSIKVCCEICRQKLPGASLRLWGTHSTDIQLQREADRAEERYMGAPMRCALVAWLHAALVMPLTRSLSSPTPDEIVARVFERARLGQLEAQLPPVGLYGNCVGCYI